MHPILRYTFCLMLLMFSGNSFWFLFDGSMDGPSAFIVRPWMLFQGFGDLWLAKVFFRKRYEGENEDKNMCEKSVEASAEAHDFLVGVDTEDCQVCGKGRKDHPDKEE
jgi:hypothetical protein